MDKVERALDDLRRKWVPDGRLGVFEVSLLPKGVAGVTSSRDALDALRRLAGEAGLEELVDDNVAKRFPGLELLREAGDGCASVFGKHRGPNRGQAGSISAERSS